MRRLVACLMAASACSVANAQLKFSEVMPSNLSTVINPDNFNFSGYIEIQNTSADSVNIAGYTISHKKKNGEEKWSHTFELDYKIGGGSLDLLWADESKLANHIPYKLDTDGGSLVIKKNGVIIDSIGYNKMQPRISYGRSGTSTGYMLPSPKAANTTSYATLTRSGLPVFSEKGGLRSEGFMLKLSAAEGETIFYTTNGSEPSNASTPYTGPIAIDTNMAVRAITYADGKLPSTVVTNSFVFEDYRHADCGGYTIPVVSITADSILFFSDSLGLAVVGKNGVRGDKSCIRTKANYNREWDRPANFEYFVNGEQVLSQEVEASIVGGCSRGMGSKSYAIKASKRTGNNELGYRFFQSKPNIAHQTIHMRNGGTAYNDVRFRDGLIQTFAIGMNIDYQAYQPVAFYLNGVYHGLFNLNERTNADYIKANYGINEDDIDLITVSDQKGIQASKGDLEAYNELVNFLTTVDEDSPELYTKACKMMDMDEYIDYQILQQFVVNCDWPGNNTKIWRERKKGSRFRWILFDTDFGFALKDYLYLGNYDKNMLNWCLAENIKLDWANKIPWMTAIFKNLSLSNEFRRRFTTKYLIQLSTSLNQDRINAVFDSITGIVTEEYCAHYKKDANEATKKMRTFALLRHNYIPTHLKGYIGATGVVKSLEINANIENATFTINGEKVNGFKGKYLSGFFTELKAYAPEGYKFDHWELSADTVFQKDSEKIGCSPNMPGVLKGNVLADGVITAVFVAADPETPTIVINEICASSNEKSNNPDDYDTYPDWIELYNYGENDVDVAGLFLSNEETRLALSQIPYGSEKTIIKPKRHLLLWAKGDQDAGFNYLNFKLNVDKPKRIFLSDGESNIISQADFEAHEPNESWGYNMDNDGDWRLYALCTDGLKYTSTPGKMNHTIFCTDVENIENDIDPIVSLFPNPANDVVNIKSEEPIEVINIFDTKGQLIATQHNNGYEASLNVRHFGNGLYFVEVQCKNNTYRTKLIKD
ncbi:MAG: CotH kinase family protein [Paludibacteraceae bacterium]|nr:CotH kinase family protein [Paludibacteraceae bacterium]